ncbi:TetR/AcrR family transcriptional regulator [Gaetbulibacter saemankumensis]|uniref:TetR/AcrR family transcriptional regulator n=1 Tax=Gaetbulibacter saemankumensis TaxID=311208 RepID=UPI000407FF0F|nr:TetR/AcrR family transcriptional regulator [Gaetbulibacter saemankumensis]
MRAKIIEKASDMFLTLGAKSVTMDDIANELGISKKTIYVHFKNKTKLVEAVVFEVFETVCNGIDCVCNTAENPIEELYQIKVLVMEYLHKKKASPQYQLKKYYPDIYRRLNLKQFEKMHVSIRESLQKGINMGLFRPDLDVDLVSRFYFNGMSGIRDSDYFPHEIFNMEYLMESFLEYHLRAITTEKGLHILNEHLTSNQS